MTSITPQFANVLKRHATLRALEQSGVIIIDHNNTYIENRVSVGERINYTSRDVNRTIKPRARPGA